MRLLAAGVLVASVLASGCSGSTSADDPAPRATPTFDPAWRGMTVSPAVATSGQQVAVRFEPPQMRGIAYSLSTWTEDGWDVTFYLTSDWGSAGGHEPDWWSAEDAEGRGWVDVGVNGPGPDHVIVPDSAPPGDYQLCTANSVDESCAQLTVAS